MPHRASRLGTAARAALAAWACALCTACGWLEPASFEVVDVERARAMLRAGDVEVVLTDDARDASLGVGRDAGSATSATSDASGGAAPAIEGTPGDRRAEPTQDARPRDRSTPVLVVAAAAELGYRSAAGLARSGRSSVALVIASRDEDRRSLEALTRQRTEVTSDEQDS